MIRPGEEVHYASLLNEAGETLVTIPLDNPTRVPESDVVEDVEVSVQVRLTLKARGRAHA